MANSDAFWKPPSIYDVVGVVGVVFALFSIWLSWWLAKRDIRRKIEEAKKAARSAVTRLASRMLHNEIQSILQDLAESREFAEKREWVLAVDRCRTAYRLLARLRDDLRLLAEERTGISGSLDNLRLTVTYLEKRGQAGAGTTAGVSAAKKKTLDDLIAHLGAITGRLEGENLRVEDD